MNKIKMVQYGCGKMSKMTIGYALEKGVELVGAFDIDENKIGKDASILLENSKELGVKIQNASEFDSFLQNNEVDIVIVTTTSILQKTTLSMKFALKMV